jgi:N-acetylglucosaminyldiphosphoundecaprenol N-acetyl-beta-D-mannosaminyltransferase
MNTALAEPIAPPRPDDTVMTVEAGRVALADRDLFVGTMDEAVARIVGLASRGGSHLVVTPNVDQVLNLTTDQTYRRAYEAASLRLIDGMPLVWLAASLGASGIERCTGADLLVAVAGTARLAELRVCLLGGDPEISERAARALDDGRGLVHSVELPMLTSVDDEASLASIRELRDLAPDVVFLGLGSPKQEAWYLHWKDRLPDAVYVGSGAAVDFAAGARTRAVPALQRAGLEWVWRLLQEPTRLAGRYLVKGPGFVRVVRASHRLRRRARRAGEHGVPADV